MAGLGRAIAGLKALLWRERLEQELDEELRAYLEAAVEDKIRNGIARDEAVRAARLEIGNLESAKDRTRDIGWESVFEGACRDVRFAMRGLRKSPGFTTAAVLTLALGIGATTAIFSLLEAVLLKSLPVRNPDELVLVGGSHYPVFEAFRRRTDIFVDLCATSGVTTLDVEIRGGIRERTDVSLVSGSYFSTLGIRAALGRTFTAADDRIPGEHPVAVASYGYWQRRFGRDAAIVDRVVRVSGMPITIIGVAPRGFFGEQVGIAPDLWIPLTMWGHLVPGRNLLQSPGTGWLRMIGRIQPGAVSPGPHPELTETFRQVITQIFGPQMPDDVRRDTARAIISLEPAGKGLSSLRARFARPLQLLMGAVVLVLLIACANIANLMLTRAAARRREIDVRLALGMSRGRLVRQLLTESCLLAAIGGALALGIAWLAREGLLRLVSADGSRVPLAVTTDLRLLALVAGTSVAAAILFGLAPVWQSVRTNAGRSLISKHSPGGHSTQRLSSLLVAAQVALSLVLLVGAGLFLRTIDNLRDVDLGLASEHLLVLEFNPQAAGYRGDRATALSLALLDRLENLAGVTSVSLSEHGVLTGRDNGTNLIRPSGFAPGPDGFPRTRWDVVGPRYFSTIGSPLLYGRDFTERDSAGAPLVVAINEAMARLFFAGSNPVGQRLVWDVSGAPKEFEIVGVVRDVKQAGPRDEPQPRFYLPYFQMPVIRSTWILSSIRLLVRTAGNPVALAPILRESISLEDPRLSVMSVVSGPELVSRTLVQERMLATLLGAFGVLAVGLACLGLYGLISYQVAQRTSEIGIRVALGAQRNHVLVAMLRRGFAWIALGIAVGMPTALSASRVSQSLLFGLSPTDPATLIGAAGLISGIGLLAVYIPARRASLVDPLIALRGD